MIELKILDRLYRRAFDATYEVYGLSADRIYLKTDDGQIVDWPRHVIEADVATGALTLHRRALTVDPLLEVELGELAACGIALESGNDSSPDDRRAVVGYRAERAERLGFGEGMASSIQEGRASQCATSGPSPSREAPAPSPIPSDVDADRPTHDEVLAESYGGDA